jgi:hypothetical protein
MSEFLESPLPVLMLGLTAEIVLVVLLVVTRRGAFLYAMGGVLLLTGLGLLIERLVVTDQKRVKATLETARLAVEANDAGRLLACIAPSAKEIRQVVEHGMKTVTFNEARIRALKITFDREKNPPTAKAQLTGFAVFQSRNSDIPFDRYMSEFVVELQPVAGQWRITNVTERQGAIRELRK